MGTSVKKYLSNSTNYNHGRRISNYSSGFWVFIFIIIILFAILKGCTG